MSAADQAKGPSEAGLRTAAYIFERLDFSPTGEGEIKLVANKVDEAAQPLAAALEGLLENLPRVECQDFHHTPKDYHDGFDCPVCKRWEKAIEQARDARRGWGLKGEH